MSGQEDMREAPLDLARIKEALRSSYVGRNIIYHACITSTNDVAKELALAGAPEGTLVIADAQSAGRGRLGRAWVSPANSNLLMSLIFYPPLMPGQAQRLTMICSLAILDAVQDISEAVAQVKWPNDILLEGKKAGGILTELGLHGETLAYAIVGIGLNVNVRVEQMPAYLRGMTTSVREVHGEAVAREALLCAILEHIERRYERLKQGETPVEEWSAHLATLGKWVRITNVSGISEAEGSIEGWAEAVDADGTLLLRLQDGSQCRILAGDVTLRDPMRKPSQSAITTRA